MQGTLLGPYRLGAQIGAGGMGTVWRATVEGAVPGVPVGGHVAVKVVHPHLAVDLDVFERFVREAGLGRAIRHENVVRTLDAGMDVTDDGELVYLAMEHVVGRTLAQLRDDAGPASEGFCRRIAREVARGLAGIHGHGVVHGDLKPENVLITRDEVVKVMDLGLARLRAGALAGDRPGRFSGSLLYAAPEQFGREPSALDGRMDLFALGVTLFELATGRHPWAAPDGAFLPRQVESDAPRLRDVRADASEFLESVVAALVDRNPDRRIRSAAELSSILAAAEDGPWARAHRSTCVAPGGPARTGGGAERAARLHGRETELAALWALLREAQAGRGGCVLLEGPPGSGRTRLVGELLDAAAGAGAVLDVARTSFGPGRTSAEGLAGCAGDGPAGATAIRVAEDIGWADGAAWASLAGLARGVRGRRALLVLTTDTPPTLAECETLGPCARIVLGPLGADAISELAADVLLAGRPASAFAVWLAERSGGNPGVALAWLAHLTATRALRAADDGTWVLDDVPPVASAPPDALAYGERALRTASPSDRELLETAACAGRAFDPALVAAVGGTAEREVVARCGALARRGILRPAEGARWEFAASAAFEAAVASVPDGLRHEFRRAFADALQAKDARDDRDTLDLVRLLVLTEDAPLARPDVERALARLDADGRPHEVAALCEAAARRIDDAGARGAVRLRHARALLALGRAEAARRVLDGALDDALGGAIGEAP